MDIRRLEREGLYAAIIVAILGVAVLTLSAYQSQNRAIRECIPSHSAQVLLQPHSPVWWSHGGVEISTEDMGEVDFADIVGDEFFTITTRPLEISSHWRDFSIESSNDHAAVIRDKKTGEPFCAAMYEPEQNRLQFIFADLYL